MRTEATPTAAPVLSVLATVAAVRGGLSLRGQRRDMSRLPVRRWLWRPRGWLNSEGEGLVSSVLEAEWFTSEAVCQRGIGCHCS